MSPRPLGQGSRGWLQHYLIDAIGSLAGVYAAAGRAVCSLMLGSRLRMTASDPQDQRRRVAAPIERAMSRASTLLPVPDFPPIAKGSGAQG